MDSGRGRAPGHRAALAGWKVMNHGRVSQVGDLLAAGHAGTGSGDHVLFADDGFGGAGPRPGYAGDETDAAVNLINPCGSPKPACTEGRA